MHSRALWAACSSAVLVACGGDPKIGKTATAEEYCRTVSDLTLGSFASCWRMTPAALAAMRGDDGARCVAVQHEVDAGRAAYDAAKGSACAQALAALAPCAAYLAALDPPASCAEALRGAVDPGAPCWSEVDCGGGMCQLDTSCAGHCVAYAAEGEPCRGPCAPGLLCAWVDPSSPQPTCTRPSRGGGPCPCAAGFYCDYGQTPPGGPVTLTPACKAQHADGFCNAPDECAPGYACTGSPSACVPYVGTGGACGATAVCGMGSYCDPMGGSCAPLPDLGDACVLSRDGTTAALQCLRGRCDRYGTKKCVEPKADGEPCASMDECAGYCDMAQARCAGAAPPSQPLCTVP
jgi:hypothetical protein